MNLFRALFVKLCKDETVETERNVDLYFRWRFIEFQLRNGNCMKCCKSVLNRLLLEHYSKCFCCFNIHVNIKTKTNEHKLLLSLCLSCLSLLLFLFSFRDGEGTRTKDYSFSTSPHLNWHFQASWFHSLQQS